MIQLCNNGPSCLMLLRYIRFLSMNYTTQYDGISCGLLLLLFNVAHGYVVR